MDERSSWPVVNETDNSINVRSSCPDLFEAYGVDTARLARIQSESLGSYAIELQADIEKYVENQRWGKFLALNLFVLPLAIWLLNLLLDPLSSVHLLYPSFGIICGIEYLLGKYAWKGPTTTYLLPIRRIMDQLSLQLLKICMSAGTAEQDQLIPVQKFLPRFSRGSESSCVQSLEAFRARMLAGKEVEWQQTSSEDGCLWGRESKESLMTKMAILQLLSDLSLPDELQRETG